MQLLTHSFHMFELNPAVLHNISVVLERFRSYGRQTDMQVYEHNWLLKRVRETNKAIEGAL